MPGAGDSVPGRLRAGGRALLLLADPVSVSILHQLARGSLENMELLKRIGFVSRSTYFERMRSLEALSILSRTRRGNVPPIADCQLEPAGERLLPVARRLEAWLAEAPQGTLRLGDACASVTVKALAVAWDSTLLRWPAEGPRTLTELERLVHGVGYRKLERIVRDMAKIGLLERVTTRGRLSSYGVTEWARCSAPLLAAAMRWEFREVAAQSAPVSSADAESVLLLSLPLIELPPESSGTCALLVDPALPRESLGGVVVQVADGRPVSWGTVQGIDSRTVELEASGWVRGSTLAWLGTRTDGALRTGGDRDLAEGVMTALREADPFRASLARS